MDNYGLCTSPGDTASKCCADTFGDEARHKKKGREYAINGEPEM